MKREVEVKGKSQEAKKSKNESFESIYHFLEKVTSSKQEFACVGACSVAELLLLLKAKALTQLADEVNKTYINLTSCDSRFLPSVWRRSTCAQ